MRNSNHDLIIDCSAAGVCDATSYEAAQALHWCVGQRCGNAAGCKIRASVWSSKSTFHACDVLP